MQFQKDSTLDTLYWYLFSALQYLETNTDRKGTGNIS